MATKEEVQAAAQTALDAVQTYYDQAIAAVDTEASFWKDSVTSPLGALSDTAVSTAMSDAASTLDDLGISLG